MPVLGSGRLVELRNTTSMAKVDAEYRPIIVDVTAWSQDHFGARLAELRLLGSVARGDALPGTSDIDFVVIARRIVEHDETACLQWSRAAGARYNCVTSVDIDVYEPEAARASPSTALILQTDSLVLVGGDGFGRAPVRLEARELAEIWDVRLPAIVPGYTDAVRRAADEASLRRWSRLVGKDIMKCWRTRLLEEHGVFPRSITDLYAELIGRWPEVSDHFATLWKLYRYPTENRREIQDALLVAEKTYLAV